MNLWSRIINAFKYNEEDRSIQSSDVGGMTELFGDVKTKSSVNVTEENSLRLTAVYACVRIISESIASLPFKVYARSPDGSKKVAHEHYLYSLLHDISNENQTSFEFRETIVTHLCLRGRAYILKKVNNRGIVTELKPLDPWRVIAYEYKDKQYPYNIMYFYYDDDEVKVYNREEIIHLKGLSINGKEGLSPISYAREAIGLGLAAEQFGSQYFGQGTNTGGALETPNALSEAAYNRLKADMLAKRQGLDNSHGVLILEEGLKYSKTIISPDDSQFIETRKFQISEIARIFRVPLHMLAELDKASFSNIEHQGIEFVTHTLRPWLVRIEQAFLMQLFTENDRKKYFCEFDVDGLLRGDFKTRQEGYAIGRQNGWLSANDIRKIENLQPIEDGDVYLINGNMIPIKMAMEGGAKNANN